MKAFRTSLLCLMALVLQLSVFVEVRVAGVAPELLALVAVMAGLVAGSQSGSLIAFCAGLLWDVYLATPLGLSAVSFALVAYAVGSIREGLLPKTRIQTAILAMVATAAAMTLYALLGELVGQGDLVNARLLRVLLVASVMNALLSVAAAPLMRWAVRR